MLRRSVLVASALLALGVAFTPRGAAARETEDERSALVKGDTPLPFGFNYGEVDTTRSGGMSGALRAAGNGTSAVFINPAAMTLSSIYHIEAVGNFVPEYGRIVFG